MQRLDCDVSAVIFECRHEADDRLRGSSADCCNVGVAGGSVVGLHVDAAGPAYNLAAIDSPLESNAGNTERLKVSCSHDPVPLHVPQKSV